MTRALLFILKLALLTAAAVWLASHPGAVTVQWQGYEISTSVAVLALAVLALIVVSVVLHSLYRAVVGIPGAFSFGALSRRRRQGYLALTEGMVAVAAGDAVAAKRFARKAEKLLVEPPLTMLLQAQAAQLAGDEAAAANYFSAMLDRPEMSFLGLRGLLTQALKEGNTTKALELARRAYGLQPKADWVLSALFDLEAKVGDRTAALNLLTAATKQGVIDTARARTLRATLLLVEAAAATEASQALHHARRAHELHPAFIPAALAYARLLQTEGKMGAAIKVIERTWRVAPHPELAELYVALEPALPPLKQVKRMEKLSALGAGHAEGQLALAAMAIKAALWGEARTALAKAGPSAAALRLEAELEEKEHHNLKAAQECLVRAAAAPPAAAWVCQSCHQPAAFWAATCPACQSFATLEWRQPGSSITLLPPLADKKS